MPYNALDGLAAPDLGAQWQNAIMSGMEFARQTKARSALAAYAQNPSMESAAGVIPHDPIMGLNLRRDEEARMAAEQRAQSQQAGAEREQAMKIAQLLDTVTDPQSYQQARNTAQYLGFDLSRVPPEYDPQWVDMNKRIVASYLDDNDDSLPGLAKEIAVVYKPGTPEFDEAYRNAVTGKYGVDYVDDDGNTRRRGVFTLPTQSRGQAPTPQGPLSGQVLPFNAYLGFLRSQGEGDANEWLRRGQSISVQSEQEFQQLPPGTPVVFPDGSQGVR